MNEIDYVVVLNSKHRFYKKYLELCSGKYVKISRRNFDTKTVTLTTAILDLTIDEDAVVIKQFIGLADKYGIRIYDGSKVSAITNDGKDSIEGTVVYHEFEWCVEQDDDKFPLCPFTVIDLASIKILEV